LLVTTKGRGWRDNNQGKREQSNRKEIINKDNKKGVQSKEIEGNDKKNIPKGKVILERGNISISHQTNGVNVLKKSNVKHMTNKEGFSMMMNKKKNKSKKRKVQLAWELMSKLLELVDSTKKVGE
jgi:hypothetical protein